MSKAARDWAKAQKIPPLTRFVLYLLAERCNPKNADPRTCWPSHKSLCDDSGLVRRSVITHIALLRDKYRLIEMERRYDDRTGFQKSAIYTLKFDLNGTDQSGRLSAGDALSSKDLSAGDAPPLSAGDAPPKVQEMHNYKEEKRKYRNVNKDGDARARAREGDADASPAPRGMNGKSNGQKKRARRKKQDDCQVLQLGRVDKSVWQEWIKHRRESRAPMTEYAQKLLLQKLNAFPPGDNPNEALNTAMINGKWEIENESDKRLSDVERAEKAGDEWFRSRHGGKSWEELQAERDEFDTLEVRGQRIQ